MKLLLEIKDDKADFFMELLKNLPFVKAHLKLVMDGKMKAKPIDELINEL